MTKLRPPVSVENALDRIAGVIGWPRVAAIARQAERTVRNWSDPDTQPPAGRAISLDLGLELDVAYRLAGGDGAPMLHCFATRLEIGTLAACPDAAALAAATSRAARESGEAIAAAIAASDPSAGLAALVLAEREIEQSIAAKNGILSAVRARHTAMATLVPSGPEVPPPAPA